MNTPLFPRVLLGITTHNRAGILPKAIASALAQDYPCLSIAVLDDGSTDDTPALHAQLPGVTWIRHEQSRGYMESRNELMRTPGADFYVSLDDDAWFLRGDELSLAIARMQAQPSLAAIAFDILSPDRSAEIPRSSPKSAAVFIGCGHLLRLSAVREAGFYAATPGAYGSEEKDLCLRLADLGYDIELMPGVHVWHDKAWSGRDWFPLHRSGVCNELVMTLRRCPLPDLLLVLPLKFASFVRYWLQRPEFARAGLAGIGDVLRHLRATLQSRRAVRRKTFWRMIHGHTQP
ncbi:MAG: glycosyltransferase [Verrucomicrobia bacterium]|nr:glycosyltransferase [Verrucomicrobiota bacterium]